jgi:twitching motility two-component system response regulator PilH
MPRVLLIEDNPLHRDIYERLLYYNGFEVTVAEDGPSGISEALAAKPDAIVIDVMLPGVNGIVVSQRLHEHPDTAHIPIICMSGYDVSRSMVQHVGAREFLPKPVSGDTLVRTIRRFIGWQDTEPGITV